MDRGAIKELAEQVKANARVLEQCTEHAFTIDLDPEKPLGKRWMCERCRGVVRGPAKFWYEAGRAHEKALGKQA